MADSYSNSYASSYGGYGGGYVDPSSPTPNAESMLRRRQLDQSGYGGGGSYNSNGSNSMYGSGGMMQAPLLSGSQKALSPRKTVVKKLDFMFPKVDTEYTVKTESGGMASLVAYGLIALLAMAEIWTWTSQNASTTEHVIIDTSFGKRMQVNLNVTFPGLACEDLHIDIMDIAGDSQVDVVDTMKKRRLNRRGVPMGEDEIVESNKHRLEQDKRKKIKAAELPIDYCGPCYGADPVNATETGKQCCNTCDDLIAAYKVKRWRHDILQQTAEQCIREGKDKLEPKKLRKGEGCNLSGYFMVNRVGGNFHIAMGEGIERDGRHIHTFNPDETHNFNASHIIHDLSFGPEYQSETDRLLKNHKVFAPTLKDDRTTLNGVTKIVDKLYGTTGLFQYFIKIVPTIYILDNESRRTVETNRYFFTERFRPLMKEYLEDDAYFNADEDEEEILLGSKKEKSQKNKNSTSRTKADGTDKDGDDSRKLNKSKKLAAVKAGHSGSSHHNQDHHNIKNAVLPGVFFIYEIYPFAVEVQSNAVPVTHLFIRLMATIGGVFTVVRFADSYLFTHLRR